MNNSAQDFEPQYQSGRSVFNVIAIFGWIAVLLGFVLAYMGVFSSSGGAFSLIAAPGLAVVVSGFINVALGQIGVATIDNANANREILYLMKQERSGV